MPVDPHRVAAAIVAQQREIAGALFRDQNVTIRQHQQTSRVDEAGRERRCREARRHLRGLPGVRDDECPIADDRSCLWRRQIGRIDTEPLAQFVFLLKILLQVIFHLVIADARCLCARDALVRAVRRKGKRSDR